MTVATRQAKRRRRRPKARAKCTQSQVSAFLPLAKDIYAKNNNNIYKGGAGARDEGSNASCQEEEEKKKQGKGKVYAISGISHL